MRNDAFYKITTLVSFSLLSLLVLYLFRVDIGDFANTALAEPSTVNCVKGKNGIKGKGCSGTVELRLGSGGEITNTTGFGLRVNNTSDLEGTAALYGKVGDGPIEVFGISGVRGDSYDTTAVLGISQSGWGVHGKSETGLGVSGWGSIGVYGRAFGDAAAGVHARGNSSQGVALEIQTGGIKVTDAGLDTDTPVFIHKVVTGGAGNICSIQSYSSVIDHPLTNGRSNAILIVTPSYGANNTGVAPAVGIYAVYYDATNQCGKGAGKWVIYNLNSTALTNNSRVNVLVINP